MKDYKKRAKVGWRVGKGEKEPSNRSERMFTKKLLSKDQLESSEIERLSIKNEIDADKYDEETFRESIKNRPDLARTPGEIKLNHLKNKKQQKKKSVIGKIEYFEKKLSLLKSDSYGYEWRKNYYNGEIKALKNLLKDNGSNNKGK